MTRTMSVNGIRVVHPGRGELPRVELYVIHDYLKGRPGTVIVLSEADALLLAEQAIVAVRRARA